MHCMKEQLSRERRRLVDKLAWQSCSLLVILFFLSNAEETRATPNLVRCNVGWGGSSALQTIPSNKINDGYCDCPTDGADEPDTAACSGIESWTGSGETVAFTDLG